jgi:hypothetical protein
MYLDMQIKVRIGYSKFNITDTKTLNINTVLYPNMWLGDNLFSFDEYQYANIQFLSDNKNDILRLEVYDSETTVVLHPGDQKNIALGGSNESMLTPGQYHISAYSDDTICTGYFMITPCTISWDGLLSLKKCLENVLSGLSFNLYMHRLGFSDAINMESLRYPEIYNFVLNNKDVFINSMINIINAPLSDITKRYGEQSYSKKPDNKSIRWLNKKGLSVNSNIYQPQITFEAHAVPTNDVPENRMLKKIIHFINIVLGDIENIYYSVLQRHTNEKTDLLIRIVKLRRVFERKSGDPNFKDYINEINSYISGYGEKIKDIERQISFISDVINNTKKMRYSLLNLEYGTWLDTIANYERTNKVTLRMLKDHRYAAIYNFYEELLSIQSNDKDVRKVSFPSKQTSLLFETYAVIMVINAIQKCGFQWEKGWLKDVKDLLSYNGELPSGTEMTFINGRYYINLAYDQEIKRSPDPDFPSRFVGITGRPDIRLALFDDNEELLDAIIFEVKCRKTRYLYDESYQTDVINQLMNYSSIGYFNKNRKVSPSRISKVYVLYPRQEPPVQYGTISYEFEFIQIECNDKVEDAFGFDEVCNSIGNFTKEKVADKLILYEDELLGSELLK